MRLVTVVPCFASQKSLVKGYAPAEPVEAAIEAFAT
jgi:hypothetical protein